VSVGHREIDHSLGKGELDHLGLNAAIEYLRMPERVKSMENKLDVLQNDVRQMVSTLKELTYPSAQSTAVPINNANYVT